MKVKTIPTLKDVAARAGVSTATVSRVINGQNVTRPETADRVRAAIAELGFRMNGVGRSLRTSRTMTLGVVIPSLANTVFAEAVTGMEAVSKQNGYSLLLAASNYDRTAERDAVELLATRGVDGLILTVSDPFESPLLQSLEAENLPYVLIYNSQTSTRPTVTIDNEGAGRKVAQAFARHGHRRLGMVAGEFSASDRSAARYRGFMAGAEELGLAQPSLIEVDFTTRDLAAKLVDLTRGKASPTALFCSNDIVAIAVIGALRDLGIAVPDDVSVVGFDGISVGRMLNPSLATIVQPSRRMGERAAEILIDLLVNGVTPQPTILDHSFLPGGTLGNAPAD